MVARSQRREVHGLDVLPVDLDQLHPERLRALPQLVDRERGVLRVRRRLGPAVVLEHEDRRHLPELREVERLVERARVRGAVAEERDRDALLALELERERGADDPGEPARDDGVRPEVPDLEVVQVHRAAEPARAALLLPVQLGHDRVDVRPLRDRVAVRAVGRRDDVLARERGADPGRDRLLPDRDVQEPGQLAGAEALLDLLLEAPDQEHLAEEVAQRVLRDPPSAGARLLLDGSHGPAIMLIRRCELSNSGEAIEAGLDARLGRRRRSRSSPRTARRSTRPPACSGRSAPAGAGTRCASRSRASAAARSRLSNLLGRLDRKRIWGTLTLVGGGTAPEIAAPLVAAAHPGTLVAAWEQAAADLPPGWSDVLCELELDSTDFVARAALLGSPLNPARGPGTALRFRASEGIGYGTSYGMTRRCLERMDAEGITGRIRVLEGAANVENVLTQGPVWRVGGRSV